jgi:NADPH:quinone reductase-like Zn-dependent oxidoreductase
MIIRPGVHDGFRTITLTLALIVGQKAIEGFLLSEWAERQGPLTMLWLLRQIGRLIRRGVLTTEIGASYPLEQVQEAVRQAETPGHRGKVLLRIDGGG